ncbi:MAG: hypothetical protein OQJ99_07920 [Rhodospirillales bacterium]|nr:hypothetical protein [Rhodospirillales bacterium]MCW8861903.1 hypothetical protein [Rhodospirillales bacterium]MCW8951330.1 hypothetical protein [Rhodospirillales bacterium]MCW8971275.1 hypothetical protein [Rhodospirillales bacterium]MCW9003355.1 hypothetical protein [Rhodospirillales bacterium]
MGKGILGRLAAIAAAIVPAAGCDQGPMVAQLFYVGPIVESVMVDATRNGPMMALVYGAPFPGREPETRAGVMAGLSKAVKGRIVSFEERVEMVANPDVRVIVVFGAPKNLNGERLCRGEMPELTVEADWTTVRAVFCTGDRRLSDAEGRAEGLSGPDDPRFKSLMHDLGVALFVEN